MMEKTHGQIRMVWSGTRKRSKKCEWEGGEKKMLKRYKMYYNAAVGKIEMYLLLIVMRFFVH